MRYPFEGEIVLEVESHPGGHTAFVFKYVVFVVLGTVFIGIVYI